MSRQPPPLPPLYGTPETRARLLDKRQPHQMQRTPETGIGRVYRLPGGPIAINADRRET